MWILRDEFIFKLRTTANNDLFLVLFFTQISEKIRLTAKQNHIKI